MRDSIRRSERPDSTDVLRVYCIPDPLTLPTMLARLPARVFLLSVFFLLVGVISAVAQWENIETVDGAYGREITLTKTPHRLADGLSVRAMGISASDTTQWTLSLIGAAPEDSISIAYDGNALPILQIRRPDDGVGPTDVSVSKETFLTMAETAAVRLRVGDVTAGLPADLRREMKEVFERVQ